jgi:acyl-CoA dehydrogenase
VADVHSVDAGELTALREAVRDLCDREVRQQDVRRVMATPEGHDPATWRRLAADLGVLGLAVDEEHGGAGSGLATLCVVAEELGRALLPAPLLGTVALAAPALQLTGDPYGDLPLLLAGDLLATVVAQDGLGRWAPDDVTTAATREGDAVLLSGTSPHVVDAAGAGLLLVAARLEGQVELYAVDPAGPGCRVVPQSTMDLTRRQATVVLEAAPARPLGEAGPALDRVGDVAVVVLCAGLVGVAQRLLDLSVEHARTRFQFGRPIGAFQGVKHRCADMLVAVETARSTVAHAAEVADAGGPGLALAASLAAVTTKEAAVQVAKQAVQVHGGLGFTWEHPAHLYLKRAVGDAALLGTPAWHRERLARLVLDDPAALPGPDAVPAGAEAADLVGADAPELAGSRA